jgi:N-acetylglucosamine kinase-like BadF-type ATPase
MHIRLTPSSNIVGTLDEILSYFANFTRESKYHFNKRLEVVSLAISGTDHRFSNLWLAGKIYEITDLVIAHDKLRIFGISEAIHRSSLDDQPGVVIRTGTDCSVFGVDSQQQRKLTSSNISYFYGGPGCSHVVAAAAVLDLMEKAADGLATDEEKIITDDAALQLRKLDPPIGNDVLQIMNALVYENALSMTLYFPKLVASLSEVLLKNAMKGNSAALSLITDPTVFLSKKAHLVCNYVANNSESICVAFHGSFIESYPPIAKKVYDFLCTKFDNIHYIESEPQNARVIGAAKLALADCAVRYKKNEKINALVESLPTNISECAALKKWFPVRI